MASSPVNADIGAEYGRQGWWGTRTLATVVADNAASRPDDPAFLVVGVGGDRVLNWADYDRHSTELAAELVSGGLEPGDRVGVLLPDGAAVHVSFLAAEKAGLVVAGIGARAGDAEVSHLLRQTGTRVLLTHGEHRGSPSSQLVERIGRIPPDSDLTHTGIGISHVVVPTWLREDVGPTYWDGARVDPLGATEARGLLDGRALGPDELFMLNSTSGTTGLPKCVMHTQNRWFYFHQMVAAAGELHSADIFCGAVPAPFGFGLWTAHFTPAILGSPTVVAERFDADQMLEAMERHRVSVLTCVSTQFLMMLGSAAIDSVDLSALRVMYTGGEAVPYERAAAFEDRTGATVLQVFGSNETGALSRTCLSDSRDQRLRTSGRIIDEMAVRVFDEDGSEVTGETRIGIPAGKGPATCIGYYDDEAANAALFTPDGWMLMGDVVEIDREGYLRVVGRTSDFIIRGGKNISAPAVEAEIAEHPGVALVAVVAMPDEIFGERVCAYVVPRLGATIELDDVTSFLNARGTSREWFPERLVIVDQIPRSSGAKIAKGVLRADIQRRIDAERTSPADDPPSANGDRGNG